MDPRVLSARTVPAAAKDGRLLDRFSDNIRMVRGPGVEHVLVVCDGGLVRLDIVDGSAIKGPVALRFDLADDHHIEGRIDAIRTLRAAVRPKRRHQRLADRLSALQATDARAAGASLKEIADLVLGAGDWPGDGEYRKSYVRRLLSAGSRIISSGPRAILSSDWRDTLPASAGV